MVRITQKLYSPIGHPKGCKVLITALLCGVPLQSPVFQWSDMKSRDFLMKSRLVSVPLLQAEDSLFLNDAHSMMIYISQLSQSQLYKGETLELAQIDSILQLVTSQYEPLITGVNSFVFGYNQDEELYEKCLNGLKQKLRDLEKLMKKQEFLCGEMTIADISLASDLVYPFRTVLDENFRKSLRSVQTWFEKVCHLPHFVQVFGPVKFCTQIYTPPVIIKEETKKQQQKKQPQKQQPKKQQAKKQESKKQQEPKPKKEQTQIPMSEFNMDSWKKIYSNMDRKEAMVHFWELCSSECSFWKVKYQKLEGEGEKLFITANSVEGFLHRMESMRKHSFGTLGVYGDEPNLEIMGLFYWHGQEVHPLMKDHPSFEYYIQEKLDPANEEHKKLIEEYWTSFEENETVEGLTVRDARVWK